MGAYSLLIIRCLMHIAHSAASACGPKTIARQAKFLPWLGTGLEVRFSAGMGNKQWTIINGQLAKLRKAPASTASAHQSQLFLQARPF